LGIVDSQIESPEMKTSVYFFKILDLPSFCGVENFHSIVTIAGFQVSNFFRVFKGQQFRFNHPSTITKCFSHRCGRVIAFPAISRHEMSLLFRKPRGYFWDLPSASGHC
jgi:hypothetical protein